MEKFTISSKFRKCIIASFLSVILILSISGAAFTSGSNINPSHLYLIMQPGDQYREQVNIFIDPPAYDQEGDPANFDQPFSLSPIQYPTPPYDPIVVGFIKAYIPVWAGEIVTRLEAVSVLPSTPPGEYVTHAVFPIRQGFDYSENLGKQPIFVTVISPINPGDIKITGGGQVDLPHDEHESNSFGFNIMPDNTGKLSVNLEYNDNHYGNASSKKNTDSPFQIKINGYAVNPRVVINNITGEIIGVEFTASATIRVLDPESSEVNVKEDINVYVKVTDEGEPGKGVDYFKIKFKDVSELDDYTSEGVLDHGNIQLHLH
ncbi:post-COAP-1 domain-containing protein [Chloroflexota bacterium]